MTFKFIDAKQRGISKTDWLESYHSFSFGNFYNPEAIEFRSVRVINDDIIKENSGFPEHPHREMEIITYVVSGELAHKDSTGRSEILKTGYFQAMTAGSGIQHSEYNPSTKEACRIIQIWIKPNQVRLTPGYQDFSGFSGAGLHLVVANSNAPLKIHQTAEIRLARFSEKATYQIDHKYKFHWIQVVSGEITLEDFKLKQGDALEISDISKFEVTGENSEALIFSLS